MEEAVTFSFLGFQNHCIGDCSHEFKRHLLLGRKAMTNLDIALKSRDSICHLVFPGVMYRCESWAVKKAEHLLKK